MDSVSCLIGLMYKAKKVLLGESVLEDFSKVKYLIIASDISEKSKERYLKKCHFYNIDYLDRYDTSYLSNALGKKNVKVIGLIDEGFKESLLKKI